MYLSKVANAKYLPIPQFHDQEYTKLEKVKLANT